MSKEADPKTAAAGKPSAEGGDGSRRRRKGGGLRVPSDNVPRAITPTPSPALGDDGYVSASLPREATVPISYDLGGGDDSGPRSEEELFATGRMAAVGAADSAADPGSDRGGAGSGASDAEFGDVTTAVDAQRTDDAASEDEEQSTANARPGSRGLPGAHSGVAPAPDVRREAPQELEWSDSSPHRAVTQALNEDDLEEVTEAGASRRASARLAGMAPGKARGPAENGDSGIPAAVAALESGVIEGPVPARGSGEPSEFLTEDLIEEVGDDDAGSMMRSSAPAPAIPQGPLAGAKSGPVRPPPAPNGLKAKGPPPAPKAARTDVRAAAVAAVAQHGTRERRRRGKPWYEEVFEEDYLRTLPFLTPQATRAEATFVEESLGIAAGAQIIDVGCGYGRHAMELAARGYHVVGLDFSLPLLLRGADEAQRRGLDINFVHGDMRELAFESQFDGAYCLFSTFGYFDDEANKQAAHNIARALKPGARFVVQVLNRDYLIADLPSRIWWEGDGCVVLEEVEFNYYSSRILSSRSIVYDDGKQLEYDISIRAYSLHELGKLLHAAGFRVVEISGSIVTRGRFFGNQSRDIIVTAERRLRSSEGSS